MKWLAQVPGIAWVIAGVLMLIVVGYCAGVRAGAVKVHRAALEDSTGTQLAAVATATTKSDRVVAIAHRARAISGSGRAKRELARLAVAAALDSAPPAIVQLVHSDDALLRQDSVTIAVQAAAIDTLLLERAARQQLDTLRAHELALGANDAGRALPIVFVLATATAVLTLLHLVR
jgi:hypothetical protein